MHTSTTNIKTKMRATGRGRVSSVAVAVLLLVTFAALFSIVWNQSGGWTPGRAMHVVPPADETGDRAVYIATFNGL